LNRLLERLTHDEDSRVVTNSLGESFGSLLLDDVTPSDSAGHRGVDRLGVVLGIDESGDGDLVEESGLSNLSLDARAVDDEVSEVGEDLLSSVLTRDEVEERRSVVDELGRRRSASSSRPSTLAQLTVVQVSPATNVSWERTRKRKGMLVLTPRILNSTRARSILRRAISKVAP
jgi:hypothetical protein